MDIDDKQLLFEIGCRMPIRTRLAPYYGRCQQLIECADTVMNDRATAIGARASILYGLIKVLFSKAESIRTVFKSTLKSLVLKWVGSRPDDDATHDPPPRKRRRDQSDLPDTVNEQSHSSYTSKDTVMSPQPHAMNQLIHLPIDNLRKALIPHPTSPNQTERYQKEIAAFELPWTPRKPIEPPRHDNLLESPLPPGSLDFLLQENEPEKDFSRGTTDSSPSLGAVRLEKNHDHDMESLPVDGENTPPRGPSPETSQSQSQVAIPSMTQRSRIVKVPKSDNVTHKVFNSHELQMQLRARSRRRPRKFSIAKLLKLPESIMRLDVARELSNDIQKEEKIRDGSDIQGPQSSLHQHGIQAGSDDIDPFNGQENEERDIRNYDRDIEELRSISHSDPLASLIAANGGVLPPAEPQVRAMSTPDVSDDPIFGQSVSDIRRNEEMPVLSDISMELSSLPEIKSPSLDNRPQNQNFSNQDELLAHIQLVIGESTSYSELQEQNVKLTKADILYGLLVSASQGNVELEQSQPFEEVRIIKCCPPVMSA